MRTIARSSTRQIAALRETLTRCHAYTLAGYFIAQPCDPKYAWESLEKFSGKLRDNGDGTYTIHLHSNHWYELSAGEATVSS
jgi:hypothetical protein